jgi:hypothetical protein
MMIKKDSDYFMICNYLPFLTFQTLIIACNYIISIIFVNHMNGISNVRLITEMRMSCINIKHISSILK